MRAEDPVGAAVPYSLFRTMAAPEGFCLSRGGAAAGLPVESQSRLWNLIRRAVNVLEQDRSEAWRVLS